MSTHSQNLRPNHSSRPLPIDRRGGRPRVMALGMATVAASLGAFWLLQFRVQNRSHTSSNPGEVPTWQVRHAQQVSKVNDHMSSPGGGTSTSVQGTGQHRSTAPADKPNVGDVASSENEEPARKSYSDPPIVGSIITSLVQGNSESTTNGGDHVGQPASTQRLNDRGGIYTKNTDYKDGYMRK